MYCFRAGRGWGGRRCERLTEDEVLSAVRAAGGRTLMEAEVVVLESDGSLTALLKRDG